MPFVRERIEDRWNSFHTSCYKLFLFCVIAWGLWCDALISLRSWRDWRLIKYFWYHFLQFLAYFCVFMSSCVLFLFNYVGFLNIFMYPFTDWLILFILSFCLFRKVLSFIKLCFLFRFVYRFLVILSFIFSYSYGMNQS